MTKYVLLLVFGLILPVSGAAAQAPPTVTTPPAPTATAAASTTCTPTAQSQPRPNTEPGATTGQAGESLTDQLAKSNGVLCPPSGVDPEMRAPTPPDSGNTPVIPPPGSPGGNPKVQPK